MDAYLGKLAPAHRSALQNLREAVIAAAPGAVETISYRIPAFRLDGRMLAWYASFKDHCSFFPGVESIRRHSGALRKFQVSKGTIRFVAERPLPRSLVAKLVRTRIARIGGR